jgi:general secretion pathway protein A
MYLDYWGLKKHAFKNVPDPDMYFEMHETVENTVAELLFAIEEADECLAVVVGEVGLGKTMSLRVTLDALNLDKYAIAFITNPDLSFVQLLREIIGQLTNSPCTIKTKDRLLEEFNRILFQVADDGRRVIIFIDEGNAMRRVNLDNLRLITNMQEDDRNLFTLVLAGQPELAKKLEHPSLANLFQRIGVYCKLQKMANRDVIKYYVEHRLERAGAKKQIFSENAYDVIWNYSEHGVPRLINRLCKLALKAGETNQLEEISGDIVEQIASRFVRASERKAREVESVKNARASAKTVTPKVAEKEAAAKPEAQNVENITPKVVGKIDGKPKIKTVDDADKEIDHSSLHEVLDRMKQRHSRPVRATTVFG